jgi:hypothetical protein
MNPRIRLSDQHPSLLEKVVRYPGDCAPVIVNQDAVLIDGYRRFQADPEIDAIEMKFSSIYDAAFALNRNTRKWEDIDRFLWARWADSLGIAADSYPDELRKSPAELLSALANRKLQLGQALRILEAPAAFLPFLVEILTKRITLNVNETAVFIDMTFDLANRMNLRNIPDLFLHPDLNSFLEEQGLSSKQRGEGLLKAMRRLRYPLYQQKSEEKAAAWKELKLDHLQGNQGLFLTRGVLEITLRARSHREMSAKVKELYQTLKSSTWSKLWSE